MSFLHTPLKIWILFSSSMIEDKVLVRVVQHYIRSVLLFHFDEARSVKYLLSCSVAVSLVLKTGVVADDIVGKFGEEVVIRPLLNVHAFQAIAIQNLGG